MRFTQIGLLLTAALVASSGGDGAAEDYTQAIAATGVAFEMVWIAEGGFWIGRHEVTWDEYLLFCDFDGAIGLPKGVDGMTRPSKPLDDVTPFDREWGLGRRPAVGMSRQAAADYCTWVSRLTGHTYRLPTAAEWELACGPAPADLNAHAWHEGNSDEMTHEVGTKLPNAHGVHDMLGNLWEYLRDPVSPDDPERAVLRGGSWYEPAAAIAPAARLLFDDDWVLDDPNMPPGRWWVPDGDHLGFRMLRVGEAQRPAPEQAKEGHNDR
ncbi:MAG: SUMF1/EgtB/PvdO family nonheme iron enzyme [Planctomycetota bacterium]